MFNLTLTGFLEWLVAIFFSPMTWALLGLGLLGGCVIKTSDQGEYRLGFEHAVTVSHTSSTTNATAEASIDGKPLVEHILKLRKDKDDDGEDDGGVDVPGFERQSARDVADGHLRK